MWGWIGGTSALLGASAYFIVSQHYFPDHVRIVRYANDEIAVKNETSVPILVTGVQYHVSNSPSKRIDVVMRPQEWTVPQTQTFTHTHDAGEFKKDIVDIGVTFRVPYVPISFTVWRGIDMDCFHYS